MTEEEVMQGVFNALVDMKNAVNAQDSEWLTNIVSTLPDQVVRTVAGALAMQAFA